MNLTVLFGYVTMTHSKILHKMSGDPLKKEDVRGELVEFLFTHQNPDHSVSFSSVDPNNFDAILFTTEAVLRHTRGDDSDWNSGNWFNNPNMLMIKKGDYMGHKKPKILNLPPEQGRSKPIMLFSVIRYPDNSVRVGRINPQILDGILISEKAILEHLNGDAREWNTGDWKDNPRLLLMAKDQERHCHWACKPPQHPTAGMKNGRFMSEFSPVLTHHDASNSKSKKA